MSNETANPDMIIMARDIRQINQKQLAAKCGIKAWKISKYERGIKPVPPDDLRMIAETLSFPIKFFLQDAPRSYIKFPCKRGHLCF